jgi:hypothetical protein
MQNDTAGACERIEKAFVDVEIKSVTDVLASQTASLFSVLEYIFELVTQDFISEIKDLLLEIII